MIFLVNFVRIHFPELFCLCCNFKDSFPELTDNFKQILVSQYCIKISFPILHQNQVLKLSRYSPVISKDLHSNSKTVQLLLMLTGQLSWNYTMRFIGYVSIDTR